MIRGCLRNLLAGIGCASGALVIVVGAWIYREPLTEAYRAFKGTAPPDTALVTGPGYASEPALRSAWRKHARMARADGPQLVTMSAAELAALILDGLDPVGRRALDSLAITLQRGRFAMEAVLVTEVWGKSQLGILSGLLQPREPLRVAGPVTIERAGVMAWRPDEFSVRGLPLPQPAITAVVNRLTGGDAGHVLIGIPWTVADIRILPRQVTFYRQVQ